MPSFYNTNNKSAIVHCPQIVGWSDLRTCLTSQRLVSNLFEIFISVFPAYVLQWEGLEVGQGCLGKR